MADDEDKKASEADKPGADALNSTAPKHEKQPDATRDDGSVDKEKLREQIERQKEMAAEDDEELKREREKR